MTVAMIWVWIYMGMIVGVAAVFIVLYAIFHDFKSRDDNDRKSN